MIQQFYFWVYTQKELKAGHQRDICIPIFIASRVAQLVRNLPMQETQEM